MSSTALDDVILSNPADLQQVVDKHGVETILENKPATAHLSYYEHALDDATQEKLDRHFRMKNRNSRKDPSIDNFTPLADFTEKQRESVMEQLAEIQLTIGCNAGVRAGCTHWCAFDAVPGVREQIPFPVFQNIVDKYGAWMRLAHTEIHRASDVSDYRDKVGDRWVDVRDVLEVLSKVKDGYRPFISTVFSKGSRERMKDMQVDRVSRFDMNHTHVDQKEIMRDYPNAHVGILEQRAVGMNGGESHRKHVYGVGCMNGLSMTPRGVYSVALSFGVDDAFPQKEVVVPYTGENEDTPEVGDDIRNVLMNHAPLLTWIRNPFGINELWNKLYCHQDIYLESVQNVVLISNPEDRDVPERWANYNPIIVVYRGTTVEQVTNLCDYKVRGSTPLIHELNASKGCWINRHTENSGMWCILQMDLLNRRLQESKKYDENGNTGQNTEHCLNTLNVV